MPPKKRIDLPDHVREAVLSDIALTHEAALTADQNDKVRIYLATEQGLDTYEIAERLGISQTTASKYKLQGKAILEEREREKRERESGGNSAGGHPDRSGELQPDG